MFPTNIIVDIRMQVYAQNEELRAELEKSKRNESLLQEQICKVELKLKLSGGEHMETQLKFEESKLQDVKSDFSGIDEVKMMWTEEVANNW